MSRIGKRFFSLFLSTALATGAISAAAAPAPDAPVLDGKTLVTLGDSLTAQSNWAEMASEALNMKLVNAGIGGHTSADGIARFDRDVAAANPDYVVIAFGTNDFVRWGADPTVTLDNYRQNMSSLVGRVRALDATPLLFTAPYVRDDAWMKGVGTYPDGEDTLTDSIDVYNRTIREIAAEQAVDLVDMREMCSQHDIYDFLQIDGVHLSLYGQKKYAETLVAYMQEHFRQDADAPRVEYPRIPTTPVKGTQSLISLDPSDWTEPLIGTIKAQKSNNSLRISNTSVWGAEYHYSPSVDKGVCVPLEGTKLNLDLTIDGTVTNILLYFNGVTPTHNYDTIYMSLPLALSGLYSDLKLDASGNIQAGQTIKGSFFLTDLGVPESFADENGNILFSGVKLHFMGANSRPSVLREFSVTTGQPASEKPHYQREYSLLPQSIDSLAGDGIVSTINQDGSLTLSQKSAGWFAVSYPLNQTIDLSATPYIHFRVTPHTGTANGFFDYIDEAGQSHQKTFTEMLYGKGITDMNIESPVDKYIHLPTVLESSGTITVTQILLSDYGSPTASLTWHDLSVGQMDQAPEPSTNPSTDPSTAPSGNQSTAPSTASSTDPSSAPSTDPSTGPSENPSATPPSTAPTDPSPSGQKPGTNPSTGVGLPLTAGALLTASAVTLGWCRKKREG
ncbi:MAG: hypothetical protein HFJ79_04475 [Clostridiales bacterium]|nr:hypothetical protein [Clostridiales bacterium]